MPTNRQMELQDAFDAARIRIKLIRDGILDDLNRSLKPSRTAPRVNNATARTSSQGKYPNFNIPATRPYRLKTSTGSTSFHFANKSIAKVTFATSKEGVRNRPGAAKKHSRYIERECAVANPLSDRADLQKEAGSEPIAATPLENNQQQIVEQDSYLVRPSALALQPNGNRALLTNIDPDDEERANFWKLVERHERTAGPDKMSFCASHHAEFWTAVAKDPACPNELREKLQGPEPDDLKPFKIGSGKKVRAFLRKQEGWVTPKKKSSDDVSTDPPMATFADGRGGRTQYRIEFELPAELSPAQNFELLRDFCQEFEKRKIPFVAVMHAPDQHNHDANWHAHVAYYDRPAKKIQQADINGLQLQGFDIATIQPGMWDFAVELPTPGRSNRNVFPLRQNKVSEITRSKAWPKKLRDRLAAITNCHLELGRAKRRVNPGTFDGMGIVACPQEHLGSDLNAAETQGHVTRVGIANEKKQWLAIQAEADAQYQELLMRAATRVDDFANTLMGPESTDNVRVKQLRSELEQAALLQKKAFLLQHEMDRAASRAHMIRQRNEKLLRAYKVKEEASRPNLQVRSARLVQQASEYLRSLDERLASEKALLGQWHAMAEQCDAMAKTIELGAILAADKTSEFRPRTPVAVKRPAPAQARPRTEPSIKQDGSTQQEIAGHREGRNGIIQSPRSEPTKTFQKVCDEWLSACAIFNKLKKERGENSNLQAAVSERNRLAFVLSRNLDNGDGPDLMLSKGQMIALRSQSKNHSGKLQMQSLAARNIGRELGGG